MGALKALAELAASDDPWIKRYAEKLLSLLESR